MMNTGLDDGMIECPYNKIHRMLPKRLQSHLIKCRVNYPDVELRKCPFNLTHLIPDPEYVFHVTNCSDRKLITQYKYVEPEEEYREPQKTIECDENWDDTEVNDYDPRKHVETANVLRRPEGLQPAQRKAFVKMERKRLGGMEALNSDECDNDRCMPPTPPPPIISDFHVEFEACNKKSSRDNWDLARDRSRSPPRGARNSYNDKPSHRAPRSGRY